MAAAGPCPMDICATCKLHGLCHPGVPGSGPGPATRRRLAPGEALFESGAAGLNLHAVRKGSLKCVSGQSFVRRFVLPGEVVDLDGLGGGAHACDAVALEPAEVCEIPCWRASLLADSQPAVAAHLRALVSSEILRTAEHARLLSRHDARSRVAGFLAHLAERRAVRGQPATTLRLSMTRRDIGAHLGITLESVSRALSRMQADGLLRVNGRRIVLVDKAFFAAAA